MKSPFHSLSCSITSVVDCVKKNHLMHNLFLVYFANLYTFRAYLGPSSGGTTVCIQQLVLIILFRRLTFVVVGANQDKSPKKNNKYQVLYTYGLPPDDGPRYARNM